MEDSINIGHPMLDGFLEQNRHVPELQFFLSTPNAFTVTEVEGAGIVNYIFRLESLNKKHSVILKHGKGHARCNPKLKFSLARFAREYKALKLMDRLIVGSVPKPYCYDSNKNIVCMEDLGDMRLLGEDLLVGSVSMETATNIGRLLAQMHIKTSKAFLPTQDWHQLEEAFSEREDIDTIFGNLSRRIFVEDEPVVSVSEANVPVYQQQVKQVLAAGMDKILRNEMERRECLIHGDCHWMSIFIKSGRTALIDFEFAHLGNPLHHLAWTAISYYICMLEATRRNPKSAPDIRAKTEEAFLTLVGAYFKEKNCETDGNGEITDGRDISIMMMFCGAILFFFAVIVGGDWLIPLTQEDKSHLMKLGTNIILNHENILNIDTALKILFHTPCPDTS